MKAITLLISAAVLSACANNPARLAKPVEAHGKVFGSLSESAGAQMENYANSTRLSLLKYSEIPQYHDYRAPNAQVEDVFNRFHGITRGSITDRNGRSSPVSSSQESKILSRFLVCNPLNAAAVFQDHQKALGAFGKSMGKLSGDPPASLAGLISSLKKDYELKFKTPEDGTRKYPQSVCDFVVTDALSAQPAELDELMQRNFNAINEGKIGGKGPLTGLGEVFGLISAIKGILEKGLTLAEQKKRYDAISTFFETPSNIEGLTSSIQRLDLAVHVALQGSRVSAKEDFRSSWQKYKYTVSNTSGGDRASKQQAAADQLLASLQKLDPIIKSETAMKDQIDANGCVNLAKPKETKLFEPCFRTGFGKSMHSSVNQMKTVVTNDWDKMSAEQKVAYWDSVYSSLSAMNDLNTELQKFGNDKENFKKLNNVLDDLFR